MAESISALFSRSLERGKIHAWERRKDSVNRTLELIALLLCCCVPVPALHAKDTCSTQTLVGTYAVYEKGASSFLNLTPPPSQFPFFAGITAPFVNVGEVAFSPTGVGTGFYWIKSEPWTAVSTRKYIVNLSGISATIEERIFVFDEGREIRSVPTSIQQGIDTLAWFGVWRRISKSNRPVHSCGPWTARGTYLLTAENIVNTEQGNVADALFIREQVSWNGDYTGTLYEKLGPLSVDGLGVTGKYDVNMDCSFRNVMVVAIQGVSVTVTMKGVFYNQGHDFYALAMDLEVPYSFIEGKRIGP
jgi:hypothetical protein